MKPQRSSFNYRSFTVLVMTMSGLGLPLTGFMNHLYQFEPISFPRHAWMTAHNTLATLFAIFALCHTIINRKALFIGFISARNQMLKVKREAIIALCLVGSVTFLLVSHTYHLDPTKAQHGASAQSQPH